MKSKLFRAITAVILAVAMIIPVSVLASAADTPAAGDVTPVIVVSGMMLDGIKVDPGAENERQAFNLDVGSIVKAVFKGLFSFSEKKLVSAVGGCVADAFADVACGPDGLPANPDSGVTEYPLSVANYPDLPGYSSEFGLVHSLADRYGAQNVYFFFYDWRLDTQYNADKLQAQIELAKSEHNCDKVNVVCCSMGGVVTLGYLYKYGHSAINKIIFNSSTYYGTDVATDCLTGNVGFTAETLYNEAKYWGGKSSKLVGFLCDAGYKLGLFKLVAKMGNRIATKYNDMLYDEVLVKCFGCLPGFWALVQPDRYEEAKERIFGGKEADYAGIIAIADRLHEINEQRDEILASAVADGIQIAFISGYNIPLAPVYEHCGTQGDGTLETRWISGGATVADYGKTLTDEQKAGADAKYISPDNVINASTCAYPEYTWFIKNGAHVFGNYGSDSVKIQIAILDSETQATVDTFPEYPRFLVADDAQNFVK